MKVNLMLKKFLHVILLCFITFMMCSCATKEEILEDLKWCFHYETSSRDTIDEIIYETVYLPAEMYFITDDDKFYLSIDWTINTDDITLQYEGKASSTKYTIFHKKLSAIRYYSLKINKFNEQRSTYTLTGTVEYKKVKYSKDYQITIGSVVDKYIGSLEHWFSKEDKIGYLNEIYTESDGHIQGKPDTKRSIWEGELDLKTGIFSYQYSYKKYVYPSTNISGSVTLKYNTKTKVLTYVSKNITINMDRQYTQSDYDNYVKLGVDFEEITSCGFFSRLAVIDSYYEQVNKIENVSIFYSKGNYSFGYLFNN